MGGTASLGGQIGLRTLCASCILLTLKWRKMKKTITLIFFVIALAMTACAPRATVVPTPTEVKEPSTSVDATLPAITDATVTVEPSSSTDQKQYTNAAFKFGFKYPANWFGPDEYISDNTLRLAVGSDVVYPYGQAPEIQSEVKNSYLVVLQYTKNNQNAYANEAVYQALLKLADGESHTEGRSLYIRVRQLQLGRFEGLEYISTNSAAAQTDRFYAHEVVLMDKQTNDLITILAQPNNVEVTDTTNWFDVYKNIDDANTPILKQIVESITAE